MRRLCRYDKIITTHPEVIEIQQSKDAYVLTESYPDPTAIPSKESLDFGVSAVLRLCEISAGRVIRPLRVEFMCTDTSQADEYRAVFDAPVQLCSRHTAIHFSRGDLEAPLLGSIPEVAKATDRISEQYIESLEPSKAANKVRQLLIDFLPSGDAHQGRIAGALHCSVSTLQRQLQSEGSSYRAILEDTRRSLAKEYLRDGKNSHAQIAYLLGFSDQSNFCRAFKRWTGVAPRKFQTSVESSEG
jgi:AraC-like DNA-binding protein